jgi:AcrR family transcriptional regulator
MARAAGQIRRRIGGRSARVQASVLKSTFDLLGEKGTADFSIADVAERAGVHETSIYRRWPTRAALILDACRDFTDEVIPIPDTGALRSDLIALHGAAKKMLTSRRGQAVVALSRIQEADALARRKLFWRERFERLRVIFDRAVARGEFPRDADPIFFLEMLIAPFYFRLLVTGESVDSWPVTEQVDRLLAGYAKLRRKK